MPAKRILWPTDFFDTDRDALAVAGELAAVAHAELFALHVIGDVAEEVYEEKTKEGKDRAAWALWKISKEKAEKRLGMLRGRFRRGAGAARRVPAQGVAGAPSASSSSSTRAAGGALPTGARLRTPPTPGAP